MYSAFKNKFLVSLFAILATTSFGNLSAEQKKTWSKDASDRVLIYRAEPSKLEAAALSFCAIWGLPFIYIGLRPEMNRDAFLRIFGGAFVLCGTLFSGTSLYLLNEWYHDYDSLHKPLIIIDKYGISYEGKDKILWKNVCECQRVNHIVFTNNGTRYWHGLEITTDVEKLQIYENKIAITLPMLFKLIDEAYSAYQASKRKKINV
jgi:hypothetical protein